MATRRDSRAPVHQNKLTLHEAAIRMLILTHPSIHRNGFKAAVRALWEELDAKNEWGSDPCPEMRFLPDAYRIDREGETLWLYEVEDSNPISPSKLGHLGMFWFDWDCAGEHEWLPRLVTVDRYGRSTGEIDLCAAYHCICIEEDAERCRIKDARAHSPLSLTPSGIGEEGAA